LPGMSIDEVIFYMGNNEIHHCLSLGARSSRS
jgi:hypothetical protein